MVKKIISGGQTGGDQGGLEAAKALGLQTGGAMPLGFRTELGARPDLAERFGLKELQSTDYAVRTRHNIANSDGTIIFGDATTPGSSLTLATCLKWRKPVMAVGGFDEVDIERVRNFIQKRKLKVLNIAGNRESKSPGLQSRVRDFLIQCLAEKISPSQEA